MQTPSTPAPIRTNADDLRIGDVIIHNGTETRVDAIERNDGTVITNPTAEKPIVGYAWQNVYIRRQGS